MELRNLSSSLSFWSLFVPVIILYFPSLLQPTGTTADALSNETDRFALLKFKESLIMDPYGVLSSWNDSVPFCDWPGIACNIRHQRVKALKLQGNSLPGNISPYIGNLSFLRLIDLSDNRFFGKIPEQVDHLFRLQHLNLSYNLLEGKIPANLSRCSELRVLQIGGNKLTGTIPSELGALRKLETLNLHTNNLAGGIPASLGNLSSLRVFSLACNSLVGNVPDALGNLKQLTGLGLGPNNLSGIFPLSLYNMSSLMYLALPYNHFKGTLPRNIGRTLPNLLVFGNSLNELSGTIPESFSNISHLQILDISGNNFFGQVPTSFGNLQHLRWLGVSDNNLGNYSTNSLDFLASLKNCSQLKLLEFNINSFGGVLPNAVANLSTKLTKLLAGENQLSGNIPPTLENLINLTMLGLGNNHFTGVIPHTLGRLKNMQDLNLESNSLLGPIPFSIGNLTQMSELHLSYNKLNGNLPPEIGLCKNLLSLDISSNTLSGTIPKEIFGLPSLSILLNLSQNSFTGSLPIEVGKLKNINTLDFSKNNLTQKIPETIGDCQSLEFLYLQGNFFQGNVPSALTSVRGLRYLDLSQNNLSGKIPKDLEKLRVLQYLNLSFNNLEGEVPNRGVFQNASGISLVGNSKLCGDLPKLRLPRCPAKDSRQENKTRVLKLAIIIVCVAALFLFSSSFLVLYWRRKSQRKLTPTFSTMSSFPKVSYKMLYQATGGFSPSMLIGTGSFGHVYRGILGQEENEIAVKVLNIQTKGASKSFLAECNALRHIRHRNLVKIVTCCSSMDYNGNEFKALVFEYVSNGSLEKWLHPLSDGQNRSTLLDLIQRLNIVLDVASVMYYLHEDCGQPIIHCDLKPSNVLLDNAMIAHVSDFGLARLLSSNNDFARSHTSTNGIKGTVGYVAPEYAMGGEPSKQGDVYSFGILVLEMFTGRRPTHEMFKDDFNLHTFVKKALPERLVQIVDSALLSREVEENVLGREGGRDYDKNGGIKNGIVEEGSRNINFENPNQISARLQKCLASVLEIGVACSEESPNERMNMGDVKRELQHILNACLGVGFHEQTQ